MGHEILNNITDGCVWILEREYFSDPVHVHIYEQEIPFFHHMSSFLAITWFLLHCIYPETS